MNDELTPQGWIEKCAEILSRTTIPDRPYRPGGVVASVILHEYRAHVASQPLAGLAERIVEQFPVPKEYRTYAEALGSDDFQDMRKIVSAHLEPIGEVLRECRDLACQTYWYASKRAVPESRLLKILVLLARIDALLATQPPVAIPPGSGGYYGTAEQVPVKGGE